MNRVLDATKTSARWEAIVTELIVQVRDNAKESESAGTEKNPLKKPFFKIYWVSVRQMNICGL